MTKINRKLNLVMPLSRGEKNVYVHSTPISQEVFKHFFLVIGKTFAAIHNEGLGIASGPRLAALLLEQVATQMNMADEVQNGLVAEIRRLTTVILPSDKGWQPIPYAEALQSELIDPDEASEVDNALAFFTVASVMYRKAELLGVLGMMELWGAQITSLNSTEYANSLPTSTPDDNTGEKAKVSSIPH